MALDQSCANVASPVACGVEFGELRLGRREREAVLLAAVPANLSQLGVIAFLLPASAQYLACFERRRSLGQLFESVDNLPSQHRNNMTISRIIWLVSRMASGPRPGLPSSRG